MFISITRYKIDMESKPNRIEETLTNSLKRITKEYVTELDIVVIQMEAFEELALEIIKQKDLLDRLHEDGKVSSKQYMKMYEPLKEVGTELEERFAKMFDYVHVGKK